MICYKRSKYIERSTVAQCFLDFHIGCDLVHRHMSGSFDHNLYILLPGAFCKLAKGDQLFNLSSICLLYTSIRLFIKCAKHMVTFMQ